VLREMPVAYFLFNKSSCSALLNQNYLKQDVWIK